MQQGFPDVYLLVSFSYSPTIVDPWGNLACGYQNSCILIFSDVIVYAVPSDSLDEPTLRKLTTDVLRDAINGNVLSDFLQG